MRRLSVLAGLLLPSVLLPAIAHADITGFGDFSGFTYTQLDGGAAPTIQPGIIRITNQASNEHRGLFDNTPQTISHFIASFDYQVLNADNGFGNGMCFVLAEAPGPQIANGGYLAYSNDGLTSVATTLEVGAPSASGLYMNGHVSGGSPPIAPLNFHSGDLMHVVLTYTGSTLHETITDTATSVSFDANYFINLSSILGQPTAYVGFTAATNDFADQYLSNFHFTSAVPSPAPLAVFTLGVLPTVRRRRR